MLQIAVPSVLQQSIDMMIVQAVVNPFGTQALAGYAATMRVELVVQAGRLANCLVSYAALRKFWPTEKVSYLDKFGCQDGLFLTTEHSQSEHSIV